MTGVRLAASVALILTVTGELVIGSPGLGKEIDLAQHGGAVPHDVRADPRHRPARRAGQRR